MKIESMKLENYYPGVRIRTRFGGLSRGKCWGRQGAGASPTWARKDGDIVILDAPGKWIVGSNDGFNRKESDTYYVEPEPPAITDEVIAEIRATATAAEVIEACDAALEGDADARRRLSRRYAEVSAAEAVRLAAERKAARAARAQAEAAARAQTEAPKEE